MSDRSFVERLADNAQLKADKSKANYERFIDLAGVAAVAEDHATAHLHRKTASSYLNDTFYWLGHVNAYRGIAAGLELREIVEEEIEGEPTCP